MDFDLQQIYRTLGVLAKESDFIETSVYKNSMSLAKRNTGILYYDCTNFFFETEQEDEIIHYLHSIINRFLKVVSKNRVLTFEVPSFRRSIQQICSTCVF